METGKISIHTENILPIIKQFLYSEREIFLRELISNAVDATRKLKTLHSKGDYKGKLGNLDIEVEVDKKKKAITVRDNGIGMTGEEVKKYINQIAFSSAQEFAEKYKDSKQDIIGHFGLGFYSAFMVSKEVELRTCSYRKQAKPVKWISDGGPEFSMEAVKKSARGTEVILHLNEEEAEFLEKERIQNILETYCKFLPVPIRFDGKQVNNTDPAWTKSPEALTEQNYRDFYKELHPYSEEPLFWIHLNVDYPFLLRGILYFPRIKNAVEMRQNKIQLYCNQVFVTDNVQNIVPEYLELLHGVLDSPDIPLNVSRSYLQGDPRIKKISNHITKKVADKLHSLFKDDRKVFEKKWDDIQVFVKYGMLTDEKFYEKAEPWCLFRDVEDKHYTLEEYKKEVKDQQTDKDGNLVMLYTTDPKDQHNYIESAKKRNYKILQLDGMVDSHFINHLEQKLEKTSFVRVDADTSDRLVQQADKKKSDLSEDQEKQLKELTGKVVDNKMANIELTPLSTDENPVVITKPEFSRRMKDMAATSGMNQMADMPEQYNVIVNTNHPLINKVLLQPDAGKQKKMLRQAYDLGLLAQNMLKGEALSSFMKRSVDLLK